jgi:hypothetical protein
VLLSHREAAPDRFRGIRDMVCPNPLRGEYTDERRKLLEPTHRACCHVMDGARILAVGSHYGGSGFAWSTSGLKF